MNPPHDDPTSALRSRMPEIDLWIVPHDANSPLVALFEQVADAREKSRAVRFVRDVDRLSYRVSHAALRLVLSKCCGREPAELRFRDGERGKPALDPVGGIHFNLSHTTGLTVIAVSTSIEVGVDVESRTKAGASKEVFETIAAPEE